MRPSSGQHLESVLPRPPAAYSLTEAVIHGEDIARPLDRHIDVSSRSLVTVAEIARVTDPVLGGRRRSAGLTLRASDVEWSAGAGVVRKKSGAGR